MTHLDRLPLLGRGILASFAFSFVLAPPAIAQEGDDEAVADEQIEEIVTTGSRIRKDTFSTTTPIQVLSTEEAERLGINSITEMLQKATAASGEKIDAGLNTNAGQTNASQAAPDGGHGSACVNLRGLGCERTLVLINDKRLGVGGIRGAPPQPDINAIPIGMVEGVDVLTGGLSTVYGADAVAGVVNVRLKKDFEGLQFTASSEQTDNEGGEIYQASLVGGVGGDTGNITFGIEYSRQERVSAVDRDFSRCTRVGSYGVGRTFTREGGVTANGPKHINCASFFPDNWAIMGVDFPADDFWGTQVVTDASLPSDPDGLGSLGLSGYDVLLMTPGTSNLIDVASGQPLTGLSWVGAIPNTGVTAGPEISLCDGPNGDPGCFGDYLWNFIFDPNFGANDTLARQKQDLWQPYERFSLVMNSHLDLDWGHNEEFYFEGYYFNRRNDIIGANEQIFPTVPAMIPYVDSDNNLLTDANGALIMTQNPLNPLSRYGINLESLVSMDDLPQTFDTEFQQSRLVGGLLGDIGSGGNWSYDVSASYDRATGFVSQPVLLENQLLLATQRVGVVATLDANGNPVPTLDPVTGEVQLTCGWNNLLDDGAFLSLPDCVPVNLFAPSIAGSKATGDDGRFATQAEKDWLTGNRTNRTVTDTWQVQGYIFGDLFDIPGGGTVGTAFGVEYRLDQIKSQNSAIGVLGLNAAENELREGETKGDRTTLDVYGEISAPLVVDAGWADLFQVDAAVRFTDDENFGNETVYKLGALWDINEYLSVAASFNTSFRAPNLREQFLADQAIALPASADPCRQPFLQLFPEGPEKDRLISNCIQSGADVTLLGTDFQIAIPAAIGGAAGLKPETSDSFTATISASQPWTDRFGFDLALTYFDIEIEDTVLSLNPATIINRCFFDEDDLQSPFCDRVERDRPSAPATANFISFVRAGFINTGDETSAGFDITTRLMADIGRASVLWSTGTTILDERTSQEFPPSEALPEGSPIVDDVGRIGNPEITFQSTLSVSLGAWDILWQARWWDDTMWQQGIPNPVFVDNGVIVGGKFDGQDPDEVFGSGNYTAEFSSATFMGLDSNGNQLRSFDDPRAPGQMHHDVAISYNMDNFVISAGVNNLTDETPPIISYNRGPNNNGAVSSARYDLVGRSYFFRLLASF